MRNPALGLLAGATLALAGAPAWAQQPDVRILANTCSTCHGPNGKGMGQVPGIAGQSKDYLATTLKAFKSGERQATVMNRFAKGYEDAEILGLADYFSKIKR